MNECSSNWIGSKDDMRKKFPGFST